ncbi:MAG: hypothetical protein JRN52_00140 [Nitrososphaerota archaeon]|nr:hypothetical protein [Nitrososphaerota archaeon]
MSSENTEYEIVQCVDRGLSVYGPSIKRTVYWQMLILYNLKMDDIATNALAFSNSLEKILGSGGAVMAERAIANELIASFDLKWAGDKKIAPIIDHIISSRTECVNAMVRE